MTSLYEWNPYCGLYLATAVVLCAVVVVSWSRRAVRASVYLGYMMLAIAGWNLIAALELAATLPALKFFWSKWEYLFSNCSIALFLIFALAYDRQFEWLRPRRMVWLWVLPVLNVALAFTNDWHQLLWPGYTPSPIVPNLIIYHHGPAFYWATAVIFSYVFIGSGFIIHQVLQENWLSRRQGITMLLATAVPLVASVMYVFELSPWPGLNFIPASFAFTGIIALIGLTRMQLFDLIPIAHSRLIASMPDGVLVLDNNWRILDMNPAAKQILGVNEAQAIGQVLEAVFPQGASLLAQKDREKPDLLSLQEGLYVELSLTAVYGRYHNQHGWLVQIRNVTEQKQAELALRRLNATLENRVAAGTEEIRKEKEKLETVLQSAGDAIMLLDQEMKIDYVNKAFTLFTGYSPCEAVGQSVRLLAVSPQECLLATMINQTAETGQSWQGELAIRRRDGRIYNADIIVAPVFQAGGIPYRFIATHRDRDRQKTLTQARNQFMQSVSHQLRTPLTNIKLYTDLFVHSKQERWPHYAHVLSAQADRLEVLIQGMMEMVELDSDQVLAAWEPISLDRLVGDVAARYAAEARTNGLLLETVPLPSTLPPLFGDAGRLRQALIELVRNALTFTPSGGQIRLGVRSVVSQELNWVQIYVADTGPGIPPEEQDHLFERFFQGQVAQDGQIPGVGLGLSKVQAIMQAHGGEVTCQSVVGAGSEFVLWLRPLPDAENRGGVAAPAEEAGAA